MPLVTLTVRKPKSSAFKTTANWMPNQAAPKYGAPYFVDTSFPKGKALDDWLQHTFSNENPPPPGQIELGSPLFNVAEVQSGTTRWIYSTSTGQPGASSDTGYTTKYLSFNTPAASELPAGQNQWHRDPGSAWRGTLRSGRNRRYSY